MNLGKLLSAGKSVLGGGANKRYHEDRRVYLPKFNSGKNPFVTKPAEAPAAPALSPEKASEPAALRTTVLTGGATAAVAGGRALDCPTLTVAAAGSFATTALLVAQPPTGSRNRRIGRMGRYCFMIELSFPLVQNAEGWAESPPFRIITQLC